MTNKTTDLKTVERAVAAFEALALGEPYADACEAASEALLEYTEPSLAALFPRFTPATADMVAVFEFRQQTWTRENYATSCAELHSQCLDVEPKFAEFLRSGAIMERVASAGAAHALAIAKPADEIAASFEDAYRHQIAAQLMTEGGDAFEPHAEIIGGTAPALRGRIAACRARHDDHKAAELARIAAEQAAAEEAAAAEERRRYAVVVEFFAVRAGQRFLIHDRMFSGAGLRLRAPTARSATRNTAKSRRCRRSTSSSWP